jgi:hypothetical protein
MAEVARAVRGWGVAIMAISRIILSALDFKSPPLSMIWKALISIGLDVTF